MSPPTDSTASAISRARPRLGALEQQVLEEVAGAGDCASVSSREPRAHPEPDRRRAEAGEVFGDDAETRSRAAASGCVVDSPSSTLDGRGAGRRRWPPPRRRPPPPTAAAATARHRRRRRRPALGRTEVAELALAPARPRRRRTTPSRRPSPLPPLPPAARRCARLAVAAIARGRRGSLAATGPPPPPSGSSPTSDSESLPCVDVVDPHRRPRRRG